MNAAKSICVQTLFYRLTPEKLGASQLLILEDMRLNIGGRAACARVAVLAGSITQITLVGYCSFDKFSDL